MVAQGGGDVWFGYAVRGVVSVMIRSSGGIAAAGGHVSTCRCVAAHPVAAGDDCVLNSVLMVRFALQGWGDRSMEWWPYCLYVAKVQPN